MVAEMRWLAVVCLMCGLASARTATGYKNGRPFRIQITSIGRAEVEVRTARAFERMQRAAAKDGVDLVIWSGFRSNSAQRDLYARYRKHDGNLAALPGYSNHQSGKALDIKLDDKTYGWLHDHAATYGFTRTVRSEPWHWEYVGVKAKAKPRRRTS
jgi:LAS superfamily LD-carboxypeptidase LdcB